MKENKPPLFVKLFLPEKQTINKKQLISLWGQPHSKQFHVVDNPSIIDRIANQINKERRPYSSVKMKTQMQDPLRNARPTHLVKRTKKCSERIRFGKLNQQVNSLSGFIEKQVSDLNQSQIFEYKQKMLTTFLENFFLELQKECHQKAGFIRQIWNQTMTLFQRIFCIQNKNHLSNQKENLNEVLNLHKSYQEMLDKVKQDYRLLQKQGDRHKQLIKSLVINLRQRKKQIKVFEGGINQYNHRINDMSNQISQLKKEHLDILMYGHQGNMTREQAQKMLMSILKPNNQDEEDLRSGLSVKYIAPKLQRGKSDKYLKILDGSEDNIRQSDQTDQLQNQFTFEQKNQYGNFGTEFYELRNNFLPRRIKSKHQRKIDVKVQTQGQSLEQPKISESIQCSYFSKMQQLMIKNKYVQTQTKKVVKTNGSYQTDISGINQLKVSTCKIFNNVVDFHLHNFQRKNKNDVKNMKVNNTFTFLKNSFEYQSSFSLEDQDEGQLKVQNQPNAIFLNLKKGNCLESQNLENSKANKSIRRQNSKDANNKEPKRQRIRKSGKMLYKNIKSEQDQGAKPAVKQNFIKLNKVRVSGQNKNILNNFYFNKKLLPESTQLERLTGILNSYFLYTKNEKMQEIRQSQDSVQKNTGSIFVENKSWASKLYNVLMKIKCFPSNNELNISFYYSTKLSKNKNMELQNAEYVFQIKSYITQLEQASSLKKNDKMLTVSTQSETFTLKKAYKIITEVFQICQKIRSQHKYFHINFVDTLERMFYPEFSKHTKQTEISSQHQNFSKLKTIQFLKFLVRNINQNYLFKNFLFLCGISYKINDGTKKQSGVINLNRNVAISGEKNILRKSSPSKIKNELQIANEDKKQFGAWIYSSEVFFYLDMLKLLNCYNNISSDIHNSYTTLQVLQSNFDNLSDYYRDDQVLIKIKDIIVDSLRHSMTSASKLNIFKCLQIFLQKIRQRKIQIFESYDDLSQYLKNVRNGYVNEFLLVQLLNLVNASQQTQLKIMSNFVRFYDNETSIQDLMTLFVIEGFPDLNKIQDGLFKIKKDIKYSGNLQSSCSNNQILKYICDKLSKQSGSKVPKQIKNITNSSYFEQKIGNEVKQLIGEDLQNISIASKFLNKIQ